VDAGVNLDGHLRARNLRLGLLQLAEPYAGLGIAAALLAIVAVSNQPAIPQTS
jgi:hypothetical protein